MLTVEKHVWVGYQISDQFRLWVESGTSPCKTLPEKAGITGKVIHKHKGFQYMSVTLPSFPWPQNYSAFLSY